MFSRAHYQQKDDMQDTSLGFAGVYIMQFGYAYEQDDPAFMLKELRMLYGIVHPKFDPDKKTAFKKEMDSLSEMIHGVNPDEQDDIQAVMSQAIDRLMELFYEVTQTLADMGVLYKLKRDPGQLVASGGER